jgi:hypothetical protein
MYNLKMCEILANTEFPLDVSGYIPGTQWQAETILLHLDKSLRFRLTSVTRTYLIPFLPSTGDEDYQFKCIGNVCAQDEVDLLPGGATCREDNNCASGDCSGCVMNIGGDWCCTGSDSDNGATPKGGKCQEDGNCASDHCTWGYICEDKLEAGAGCQNDGDCVSGTCNWRFTCASPSRVATVNGASVVQICESSSRLFPVQSFRVPLFCLNLRRLFMFKSCTIRDCCELWRRRRRFQG